MGRVQCTSCHDAHDDKNGKFLTTSNKNGALCTTCHVNIPNWRQSSHSTSQASLTGHDEVIRPDSQISTVAENACGNCHETHNAGYPERLLRFEKEEDNCLICHNGYIAKSNIETSFNKISRHPIGRDTGIHDPSEPVIVSKRHVECVDCHNPHAASESDGVIAGSLVGVRGVSISGLELASSNHEYEICFRCHGDGYDKPFPRTPRQIEQQNTREEFYPNNPSYRPVAAIGVNQDVPSLIVPYGINSTVDCIDCHDSDESGTVFIRHGVYHL